MNEDPTPVASSPLFVGIQVRKRTLDQGGIGPVIDDLVKTIGLNALITINMDRPEEIRAVAQAAAQRSVRCYPARFEFSRHAGSVDAFGHQHGNGTCPMDAVLQGLRGRRRLGEAVDLPRLRRGTIP
jgi:hypothetical protein